MKPRIETASVDTLTIRLFDQIDESNMPWLLAAAEALRQTFGPALVELVPAYTTLMLQYDVTALNDRAASAMAASALQELRPAPATTGSLHRLPVWYDPSVGPDLPRVAALSGLLIKDVIGQHSAREYQVFALGFAPGFAYMGLVEPTLATPRLDSPRRRVAAGSVALAERQTAVYPAQSPGGWNLLGRTPVRLFDLSRTGFSLLHPGDRVQFEPIDRSEFVRLGGEDSPQENG